jgi:histone deacetylase complex regulatory component SIN3
MSGMNTMGQPTAMNQSPATIKNLTAYQTAQSIATVVQQVFEKDLKPIAQANATNSNGNIAKTYLSQLKNAVNNKASFMNVMELVHVKLHPTLIGTYTPASGFVNQ